MEPELRARLETIAKRCIEIQQQLQDRHVQSDHTQMRKLAQENARLNKIDALYQDYCSLERQLEDNAALLHDTDQEIQQMALQEQQKLQSELKAGILTLQEALLPSAEDEAAALFLEIRAGTGGDEAALFAEDLLKMYEAFAYKNRWNFELISVHRKELGGFKEVIARIEGTGSYTKLMHEAGVHRVQRTPATESQGRLHTSACTVAVLPEAGEDDEIELNPSELRIDTFRASGAGGQHVNRTDSAVRITHLPTGMVVECQDERSQHSNRARAKAVLVARLLEKQRSERADAARDARRSMVGSGDRSERIRTYNFPQNRITDHRLNLTLYQLGEIMTGELTTLVDALVAEHRARQLAAGSA